MVQWLRLHVLSAGGTGSIPDQGNRPHMLQLKILSDATKIPSATIKTEHSQINEVFLKY